MRTTKLTLWGSVSCIKSVTLFFRIGWHKTFPKPVLHLEPILQVFWMNSKNLYCTNLKLHVVRKFCNTLNKSLRLKFCIVRPQPKRNLVKVGFKLIHLGVIHEALFFHQPKWWKSCHSGGGPPHPKINNVGHNLEYLTEINHWFFWFVMHDWVREI